MSAPPPVGTSECVVERLPYLGLSSVVISARFHEDPSFHDKQRDAKALIIDSIDKGYPCIGADFGFPEYFIIHGYDEQGIVWVSQCTGHTEKCTSQDALGGTDVRWLIVETMIPTEGAINKIDAVRASLSFAVELHDSPTAYSRIGVTGLDAYDSWIAAMRDGSWMTAQYADAYYNALCWSECRSFTAPFLRAASRLYTSGTATLLQQAADDFAAVAEALSFVADALGASSKEHVSDDTVAAVIDRLTDARAAEQHACEKIRQVLPSP